MLPYQPNSDALLAPPALPVDPLSPLLLREADSFFARTILSFFSDLAFAFAGLDFGFAAGFGPAFNAVALRAGEAFARVFLRVGFGVVLAFNAGVTLGFAGVTPALKAKTDRK